MIKDKRIYMKKIVGLIVLLVLAFGGAGCSEDEELLAVQTLEVNYVNLDGAWRLSKWNGLTMTADTYCYIVFDRREHTFQMYQNFNSMYAQYITGEFSLSKDEGGGDVISGTYDYGLGDWNNSYVITDLLETGSMVWTVQGDESDICEYQRCEKVPDDIISEFGLE